jgi:hypothetical protein
MMKRPIPATTLVSVVALLPLALAGCGDTPTEAMAPPDVAALAAVAGALDADAFEYTIIRHPDAVATYVNGMNASGALVGHFNDGTRWDGFRLRGGEYERISVPGSAATYAIGINERGDVVGYAATPGVGQRAYVLSHGEYRTLDGPAGYHTSAFGIAANGVISGSYHTGMGKWQPAIWEKGVFTPLTGLTEELGADMAEGFGINIHGQVVGHFTVAGDFFPGTSTLKMYGFVYTKGQPTVTLNYPGSGIMSCAMAIGTGGDVVGHYTDIATAAVGVSGFLWQKGSFAARLVVPGAIATYPTAITPSGVIAGYAALGRPNEAGPGYIAEEWVGFTAVQKRGRR